MTAMTSFSVCRLLTNWEDQGLVKLRREVIEIHSVPRLLELCRLNNFQALGWVLLAAMSCYFGTDLLLFDLRANRRNCGRRVESDSRAASRHPTVSIP